MSYYIVNARAPELIGPFEGSKDAEDYAAITGRANLFVNGKSRSFSPHIGVHIISPQIPASGLAPDDRGNDEVMFGNCD
ncbi:MAG: hypothetical protein H0U59_05775 [Gemmatimonadaceae bacterium]|nr:hypothetical protein [Gemmatimonadaceae bacterium]